MIQLFANDLEQAEIDLRLLSKAPEMFEALKALLEADHAICENIGAKSDQAMQRIAAIDQAQALLNAIHNGGAK